MAIAEQEAEGCGLMVDVTDSQLETEAEQRMKKREREKKKTAGMFLIGRRKRTSKTRQRCGLCRTRAIGGSYKW